MVTPATAPAPSDRDRRLQQLRDIRELLAVAAVEAEKSFGVLVKLYGADRAAQIRKALATRARRRSLPIRRRLAELERAVARLRKPPAET